MRLDLQRVVETELGEAANLAAAMPRILQAICESLGWTWAASWSVDRQASVLRCDACWHAPSANLDELERLSRASVHRCGGLSLPGRVWATWLPVWVPDVALADDDPAAALVRAEGLQAALGFPIRLDGEVLGVLEFQSPQVRMLDEGLVGTMAAIGVQIGHFKKRESGVAETRLYEVQRRAQHAAEAEAKRQAFLANSTALLTSSLDYESTLALLPKLAVSTLADWCLLDLVDAERGSLVRVAVAHAELSTDNSELAHAFLAASGMHPARSLADEVPEQPLVLADADDAALARAFPDRGELELARRVGTRSLMRVPLHARGRAFGALTLLRTRAGRSFEPSDLALAEELTLTAAVAIDKAALQREAEDALWVRNRFLSIVSHDVKNALHVIELNTKLLSELRDDEGNTDPGDLSRGLVRIGRASLRLGALMRELLDVAQPQAEKPVHLDRTPTNLVVLVRQIVEEFRQEWEDRTIELEAELPQLVGYFDQARLERVFANLLSNAVKYSKPGGVIRVSMKSETATSSQEVASRWAVIEVADSGVGIPKAFLPQLFLPFRRASNVVAPHHGGTGVGLARAHQVVTRHGGTISVASIEGQGATFTVRLPLHTDGEIR